MMFESGAMTLGVSQAVGSDQYVYISGAVSDDVAALKIFLAHGTTIDASLVDNAYALPLPRALFPARVVAYDARGRIVANKLAPSGWPSNWRRLRRAAAQPKGPARDVATYCHQMRSSLIVVFLLL